MTKRAAQPDLFAEPPPPVFDDPVEATRAEARAWLERLQAAKQIPWPSRDYAIGVEMDFEKLVKTLPPEEAASLYAAFCVEIDRLWALGSPRKKNRRGARS